MTSHFDDFWWLGLASPSGFFPGHPTARLCPGANEALGLEPRLGVSEVSEVSE